MISYKEFKDMIFQEIYKEFGEDAELLFQTVHKLNGVTYEGVALSNSMQIRPVFSMEEAYKEYQSCPKRLQEIIVMIKNNINNIPDELQKFVKDIDNGVEIREKIFMRVMNYEKNRLFLAHVPHMGVLDLALTYYIGTGGECQNTYVINLNNSLIPKLGLIPDELEKLAYQNMFKYQKPSIKSMGEIIPQFIYEGLDKAGFDNVNNNVPEMFVISNEAVRLGAVCIFYKDILRKFSDMIQDDFYVLASSIHEVILLPKKENEDWRSLRRMVRDINENVVDEKEILSNEVYIFSRTANKLFICQ